ncbi:MAG: NYN domain-containing protein [Candidatus Omnitrophica bacterium]|nr:NYN domain-containing protein [Candidatus Omnitrophota bacterium]
MSLHYIIDGYNVVKQVSFLTGKKLSSGREGLVRFIERYKPQGSKRNEVTIVFDGKAEVVSPRMKTDIGVIFSRSESADDVIKRMIEKTSNPSQYVVVSDDKAVAFYCRSIGAKWLGVKDFIANTGLKKRLRKKSSYEHESKELAEDIADKITADLTKLWVKNDEKESWY